MVFSASLLRTRLELSLGLAYLCALCVLGGSNILFFGFLAQCSLSVGRRAMRYTEVKVKVKVKVKMNWYTLDNTSRNPCDEIGQ